MYFLKNIYSKIAIYCPISRNAFLLLEAKVPIQNVNNPLLDHTNDPSRISFSSGSSKNLYCLSLINFQSQISCLGMSRLNSPIINKAHQLIQFSDFFSNLTTYFLPLRYSISCLQNSRVPLDGSKQSDNTLTNTQGSPKSLLLFYNSDFQKLNMYCVN